MEIREIDPRTASDEDLLTIHRIEEACAHQRPFRSPAASDELLVALHELEVESTACYATHGATSSS